VLAGEYARWVGRRIETPRKRRVFCTAVRRRACGGSEVEGALVGSLVLNRFLIERRIGSGGFGVVYEAWDGRLERNVAVKAIESRGEARRRVLREAQAAARLNHPGIVTLYEMGEEDGNALLVTELVEGDTLAQLSGERALSDREIGEIGADLCEALDHAHARGVVHRDVKPQNVLVGEGGEPRAKLMDFGIARLADAAALTAPGDVVGTLAYMSPEQAEGSAAGPEADVYSLTLTLYECWSGENPNRRATPAATARAIGARPRPLRRLRPDLPRELCEAIDAGLQRRPSHRPGLEELGTAIEESLDRLAEQPPRATPALGLRLGVAAAAAMLGAWLAVGHGVFLP
jgi:eukaryotic-like serine/threonine-protein kinase